MKNFTNTAKEKLKDQLNLIKRGLSIETKETRAMVRTYARYTQGKATQEEMNEANKQFRDFLKTIGLGALAVLPFAPVTIPFIVKLGKKLGIEIIPSGFRDQSTED
ncbi:MAG: hypothetical protein GY909_04190 [Oligoflexia bacterium]|nr:hypothetical protein [Oligoflexia bacterium]